MEMNMREFLQRFSAEWPSQFQGRHVFRLIAFMREQGISRLVAREQGWFLASDGEYTNPRTRVRERRGNAFDLDRQGRPLGCVFEGQNPYFDSLRSAHGDGAPSDQGDEDGQAEPVPPDQMNDAAQTRFNIETELQRALRDNITQLDTGLRIIDGDVEQTVESGRIDITAEDDRGNLVVIELKAGTAAPDAVAQLLGYMGAIENPDGRLIRGILVANDFHPRVVYAAKAVPNISLKAYSFQFSFEDR